ncbi:hypothetical protein ACGRHY_21995 [Streptomyces sp. HK10]|uniref:hypothetical protein n=1 Tax=Streptomyces sp. HK10 TaxID=3373255 RepID=UPI003748AE9F
MTNRSALALAFATGYVAGRSRIKLPLGMGGALLARRLGVDPGRLGEQFKERTPQLAEATGRLRNNVREAGRTAAGALPAERLESLTGGVRGQLGRVPWKGGGEDASDASGASEEKPEEKSGEDADGPRSTGGSRKESADSGKPEGSGQSASRRAPAKKAASRTAKKTASASRKPAGAARKATGSAGKQTGKSAGNTRKAGGTAKRTGGSGRG